MQTPLTLLATAALAAAVSAQTNWVVSSTPGPDVDFADVPAAVQAASPGDFILIRPGVYTPPTVGIGVTLEGQPGVTFATGPLTLQGLPEGQQLVLRHLDLSGALNPLPSGGSRLAINSCDGVVLCQGIQLTTTDANPVAVNASTRVSFADCQISSNLQFSIVGSGVSLSGCSLDMTLPSGPGINQGTAAISVLDGVLTIADSQVVATGGVNFLGDAIGTLQIAGLVRVGGASSEIRAVGLPGSSAAIPAIVVNNGFTTGSSVLVDPAVDVQSANGAPLIRDNRTVNSGRVGFAQVPSAVLRRGPIADVLELTGPADEAWFQFCGRVAYPVLTPIGCVWIDHTSMMLLGMGTYDGNGRASLPLPAVPSGMGMVMTSQTLAVTADGSYVGVPAVTFCN